MSDLAMQPTGVGRYLRLKKPLMTDGRVLCLITGADMRRAIQEEYRLVLGDYVQMNTDGMTALSPVELYEYLGIMFQSAGKLTLMICAEESLPLALVPVLIHIARQMRMHPSFYESNPYDTPKICLWMTPQAYLNLAEYGRYLIEAVSIMMTYFALDAETNQLLDMGAILHRDARFQNHETILREKQQAAEPWYNAFSTLCPGKYPVFDTPEDAARAAHRLAMWGDDDSARWVFRGHASYRWNLTTTLERGSSLERLHGKSWSKREREALTGDFIDRLAHTDDSRLNEIAGNRDQRLALAQHYGFPTSFLDFTFNPYIAEFFACDMESSAKDDLGVIFAMNLEEYKAFLNPYEVWKQISANPEALTKEKWRRDFPGYAFPDPRIVSMPDWELRIHRQEGLFVEGSMLNHVGDNIRDRYYFRLKGRDFSAPQSVVSHIDFSRLFESEGWLDDVINDFVRINL